MADECNNVFVSHDMWSNYLYLPRMSESDTFMVQMCAHVIVYNVYFCHQTTANHLFGSTCYCSSQLAFFPLVQKSYIPSTTT